MFAMSGIQKKFTCHAKKQKNKKHPWVKTRTNIDVRISRQGYENTYYSLLLNTACIPYVQKVSYINDIKKTPIGLQEMKTSMCEMKNIMDEINVR